MAGLLSVKVKSCSIAFTNHVCQFKILRLEVTFHSFHLVDSLLSGISFELHLLELGEHIQVLRSQLTVQLGEGFVLVTPKGNLVLQLLNEVVLRHHLRVDVGSHSVEFAFQSFHALYRIVSKVNRFMDTIK